MGLVYSPNSPPCAAVILAILAAPAFAQDDLEDDKSASFGSPDAVENQLAEDRRDKPTVSKRRYLGGWFDWKDELTEEHGFSFGLDYSAAYFSAAESGERDAGSGMVRFFGAWDLAGRGSASTGALVWKLEHRHAYTDIPVSGLGFEIGSVSIIEPPFSDQGARLTNLYWRQRFRGGRATVVGGFLDSTDYVDAFALGSPWLHFTNLAFSTGTTTIDLPNDALLGAAAATMVGGSMYLIGGFGDANSDPTDPFDGFDSFVDDQEYFSHFEIGWTPSQDRLILDNAHLTFWHKDARVAAGTPSGWGANFSLTRYLNEKWMPFLRGGWADEGAGLMEASVSAGLGYQHVPGGNVLGVGINWGRPNELAFEPGLPDQELVEVFYRLQLTRALAVTPDVQYIADPALDPEQGSNWLVGLRARLAL